MHRSKLIPLGVGKSFSFLLLFIILFYFCQAKLSFAATPLFDFQQMFDEHGSIMLIIEAETGEIVYANRAAQMFYGYTPAELESMRIQEINMLTAQEVERERLAAAAEERNYFVFPHQTAAGEIRTVKVSSWPYRVNDTTYLFSIIQDATAEAELAAALQRRSTYFYTLLFFFIAFQLGVIGYLLRNIAYRKKMDQALKETKTNYQLLFETMQEGFVLCEVICNNNGEVVDYRFVDINRAFEIHTQRKKAELIGRRALEVYPETGAKWLQSCGTVALTGESLHFELYYEENDRYFFVNLYSPQKGMFAAIFTDITEDKRKKEEIEYLSFHDSLTGLYNRRFFEEELKRLDTPRNLPLSIVVGDVNGLKLTNDAFGHLLGDKLLKEAAATLKSVCRADDIIARWGGDEFVIILPKTNYADAKELVMRIQQAGSAVEVESINLSISFGHQTKSRQEEDIFDVLKNAEDMMYRHKLLDSQKTIGKTIDKLIRSLFAARPCEKLHAQSVSELSGKIGAAMNFSKEGVEELQKAGLLHDIGKVSVNADILAKAGGLTVEEWNEIKRHPEVGYRILSSYNGTAEIAEYILAHHERMDGRGYPKGTAGESVPLQAKILAVADAFDAMTSAGSYRDPISVKEAVAELREQSGTQFAPEVVEVFVREVLSAKE